MKLKTAIGTTLRGIRQSQGMTLRELSAKSHVGYGHISDVERGRKHVSGDLLEALAFGLDLSTTDFIGELYEYLKEQDEQASSQIPTL